MESALPLSSIGYSYTARIPKESAQQEWKVTVNPAIVDSGTNIDIGSLESCLALEELGLGTIEFAKEGEGDEIGDKAQSTHFSEGASSLHGHGEADTK